MPFQIGNKLGRKFKKGDRLCLGKSCSEETRRKIGKANKGHKYHLGKKHSEKTKQTISKSLTGHKLSDITKRKISESHKGEKSPFWIDGRSKREGYISSKNRRHRIRKYNNGGSHTLGDWDNLKAQYNWTCPSCKKREPEIKLSEDHIIPVSKGGSDNIENIQPLCHSCNCKKWTKIILYVP